MSKIEVNFSIESDIPKEIERLEKEGWTVVSAEPIEKINVKIIGRKFVLEKK